MTTKVLIVDDHEIVRAGLRILLRGDRDIEVVGEATDGREALNRASELLPDVILLDLSMPGLHGIEALRQVKQRYPQLPVLVLTVQPWEQYLAQAMQAGASGYLEKDAPQELIVQSIKAAAQGALVVRTAGAANPLSELLVRQELLPTTQSADQPPPLLKGMTSREKEVLGLLVQGKTNKEIAAALRINEVTVKRHLQNLYEKLGVAHRTEAVVKAFGAGLAPVGRGEPRPLNPSPRLRGLTGPFTEPGEPPHRPAPSSTPGQ
ncbi:MAG: response regulator [Dehalococcoidia bacterium]